MPESLANCAPRSVGGGFGDNYRDFVAILEYTITNTGNFVNLYLVIASNVRGSFTPKKAVFSNIDNASREDYT